MAVKIFQYHSLTTEEYLIIDSGIVPFVRQKNAFFSHVLQPRTYLVNCLAIAPLIRILNILHYLEL